MTTVRIYGKTYADVQIVFLEGAVDMPSVMADFEQKQPIFGQQIKLKPRSGGDGYFAEGSFYAVTMFDMFLRDEFPKQNVTVEIPPSRITAQPKGLLDRRL